MPRRAALGGVLVGFSLLASACGGSKSPSVASVATSTTTASSTTTTTNGSASLQSSLLAYSKCMRAHGVSNFPDPSPNGGFSINGVDRSSPTFQAAQAKCRDRLPSGGPLAGGSTTHPTRQWLAKMVKAAQCMRRHGITDFPDPSTTVPSPGPGISMISDIEGAIFAFPSSIDEQSPPFVRAATACGFPLHNH